MPIAAIVLALVLALAGAAQAQTYPSRPLTLVDPFPAGGGTDILARILAEHMKGSLGQPVIVENVGGAGGSIGAGRVARAAPDGYTLGFGNWASHVGSGAMYPLQFDLLTDLDAVAMVAVSPLWVVARKPLPADDMPGLIAWLRSNPQRAAEATVGIGSASHLCGLHLQKSTGARFEFVPYRGGAPAVQDLIAGTVDFMCDLAANSLPAVRNGQIKALAVMAHRRWFAAPDVPAVDETGVPGLYLTFWHGVWVPKGTPADIIAKLNGAIMTALADPALRARFAEQGHEIPPSEQQTPQALAAHHRAETEKWWPIIKAAHAQAQ